MEKPSRNEVFRFGRLGLAVTALLLALQLESIESGKREEEARAIALLNLSQGIEQGAEGAHQLFKDGTQAFISQLNELGFETTKLFEKWSQEIDRLEHTRYIGTAEINTNRKLEFEEAVNIYRYAMSAWKKLPVSSVKPTAEQIETANRDILAWMIAKGFATEDTEYTPYISEWLVWDEHLGVAGKTNCFTKKFVMNRKNDPLLPTNALSFDQQKSWAAFRAVMTHELGHLYGKVCFKYFNGMKGPLIDTNIEGTVQTVALEISAAMVNSGDMDSFYAFHFLLKDIAFRSLLYTGIRDHREEEVLQIIRENEDSPFETSFVEHLFKFIKENPWAELYFQFDNLQYGVDPEWALMEAAISGKNETELLLFDDSRKELRKRKVKLDDTFILLKYDDQYILYLIQHQPK